MKDEKVFLNWCNKIIKKYKHILGIDRSDEAFNRWNNKEISEAYILHELIHILTDPLYNKSTKRYVSETEIEDERELLTDKLTYIIHNLMK